jgi:serine/threonine-protein kinase
MLNFFKAKQEQDGDYFEEGAGRSQGDGNEDLELTHVGPYEIVAPIGSGGMGTVYKAVDRRRDQTIAIKVLNRSYDVDKKKRRKDYLGREIAIAAGLEHDSIVKMHNQIVEQEDRDGTLRRCLLMEYVDGDNLRRFIDDRSMSFQQMVGISIRLAEGIDFLHQQGIIHRDIKPENFLFSRDMSKVKIVDFGLSKTSGGWASRFLKEKGGTAKYMSPEQVEQKSLDVRSDIFSFGMTIYELFAGEHPCTGVTRKDILKQIKSPSYKFPPPSKINPESPRVMDKIILKAIRRQPERRYQTMTELLMDLKRLGESRI